jgi:hypothetical protein
MQELSMNEDNAVAGGGFMEFAEAFGGVAMAFGFATGDLPLAATLKK